MSDTLLNLLSGVDAIRKKQNLRDKVPEKRVEVVRVIAALQSFSDCVRYLNTRRSKGALLKLDSEAAVQDALYLMLRPWLVDLVPENPSKSASVSYRKYPHDRSTFIVSTIN